MESRTPRPDQRQSDAGQGGLRGLFSVERGGRLLTRFVILLSVFPTVALAFGALVRVPLGTLITPLVERADGDLTWLLVAIDAISRLSGLAASFMVCRLIWPNGQMRQSPEADGARED